MEVDSPGGFGDAHRHGVTDKVDVVPAGSQFNAQFGRNHATSAVSGIAGYADTHSSIAGVRSQTAATRLGVRLLLLRFTGKQFDTRYRAVVGALVVINDDVGTRREDVQLFP